MMARLLFAAAALFMAACGGSVNLEPAPFTRERADGKIPVKTELIRAQVRAELSGMPEGEAKVRRWQAIEADYHSCRLAADKAQKTEEKVFADCMANRGYVYMYPIDAEQLHNDIEFEMEKDPEKWQGESVTVTIAASPITITSAPPPVATASSDSGGYAKYLLGIAAAGGIVAAVASGGGGGGDNSPAAPPPMMTVTMPTTPPPTPTPTPIRYEVTSAELGAWHLDDSRGLPPANGDNPCCGNSADGSWLIIIPVPEGGLSFTPPFGAVGGHVRIERQGVTRSEWNGRASFPELVNWQMWNALGMGRWHDFSSFPYTGIPLSHGSWQILFATNTDSINQLHHLCAARWLGEYINTNYRPFQRTTTTCNYPSSTSYSPDIRRVVHAAMADSFNPGFAFGESGFAFSGRYDGDDRAAGFTYDFGDFGNFALRTDYIRLPSKQDGAVWLDAYRFGALTRVNDEVRLYAGVDSYKNAIFAIDAKGDRMHRLGFALGDGYAVKYEYRLNL